jgi:hypothetical protein
MAGDDPSQATGNDPGEFLSKPRWQRFVIAVMGPVMNALLAVVLLAGLYRYHYSRPAYENQPARRLRGRKFSRRQAGGVGDLIVRFEGAPEPEMGRSGGQSPDLGRGTGSGGRRARRKSSPPYAHAEG